MHVILQAFANLEIDADTDPGSDVAREASSEFLKNNPKGGESFKGSGKQSGKGKKGNTKSGSTAPAAVATAASSMTIGSESLAFFASSATRPSLR